MELKHDTPERFSNSALSNFFKTTTAEQKRSAYLSALYKAKAEQIEVSKRAKQMRETA